MDIIQQQRHSLAGKSKLRMLIILVLISLLVSTALWVHALLVSTTNASDIQQINIQAARQQPTSIANQNLAQAPIIAQHYMHALFVNDYHTMWTMLEPQIQAQWTNEQTFADYEKARFHDYTLQQFTLGAAKARSLWVNPETMQQFTSVIQLPISLQLALKNTTQLALPPENLHPDQVMQNLPFVIQSTQGGQSSQGLVLASGPTDLEAPILPPIMPVVRTAQVPILMYHHISPIPTNNVLDASLTVTPLIFAEQLDYLKKQGYHSITLNQLLNNLYYETPLPTKPIILTFDDGYEDSYQYAYPLLQQYGYSGTFYIITGKVNWDGQMTWSQLRKMLAHGMQMGSHTVHHVDIGQVLLNSHDEAQQELQVSQSTLQQKLGIVIQHFCYPSGEPFKHGSWTLRQAVMSLLAENGYTDATTDPGMTGIVQQSQYPFILLRTRVDGRESFSAFAQSIP
jgi:peptidoglycan/xylan/chitin deacetylase (PgdA/CDA1 family)